MSETKYDIPEGCICHGDGLFGMKCDAPKHATRKFRQGDEVWARDPQSQKWRKAILDTHKPYSVRGRVISDGWYIRWCGDVKEWESSGGWIGVSGISATSPQSDIDKAEGR